MTPAPGQTVRLWASGDFPATPGHLTGPRAYRGAQGLLQKV